MLYKHGFDCRGLLVLEEYYRTDLVTLREAIKTADQNRNLTFWLEYFAKGIVVQLKKALAEVNSPKFKTDLPASFWKINEKQKRILAYLENPELKITNKEVQKLFGISQITASRYLSKLANLGLILSHGKGRSVFYTKA
jgi:Fic family protein